MTWTLTRPTNCLRQNIVFSYSEMSFFSLIISLFFFFFFCYFMLFLLLLIFTKTMLLLSFYLIVILFLWKLLLFFHVPGCSGMSRNVPCPGFYRRPWHLTSCKNYSRAGPTERDRTLQETFKFTDKRKSLLVIQVQEALWRKLNNFNFI